MELQKKLTYRIRPKSVCLRCSGYMERKSIIREGMNARFWGDSNPGLRLGGMELHQYVCIVCGTGNAYQFDSSLAWVKRAADG